MKRELIACNKLEKQRDMEHYQHCDSQSNRVAYYIFIDTKESSLGIYDLVLREADTSNTWFQRRALLLTHG